MSTKTKSLKKTLGLIIFLAVSVVFGYFIGKYGAHAAPDVPKELKVWLIIFFIPAFFVVIGVHEAGHAVAGIMVKFDFKMYVVGPLMWEKESRGWKFKWNNNVNTAGGMVICLPTGSDKLANRFSIYALGGPLASLFLTIFAYGLFQKIPFYPSEPDIVVGFAKYFSLLVSVFSFFILLVTLVPFHMGGFSSDGARALQLFLGGDKARFEVLMLKIIGSSAAGIRPAELNQADIDEAEALAHRTGAPMGMYLPGIQHQIGFDRGDLDQAEDYLLKYIENVEKIPEGIRNSVWADAAFFYAFGRHDLEKAMIYWGNFQSSAMLSKAQVFAAEASIAVLKGNEVEAREKINSSRKELPNMLDRGVGIALAEKLDELEKRMSYI